MKTLLKWLNSKYFLCKQLMVQKENKMHYVLIVCQDDLLHAIIASQAGDFKNILLDKNVGKMSHLYFWSVFLEVKSFILIRKDRLN